MEPADFRLPASLREQVNEQADRLGISFSEYTRQALMARIAWNSAIEAVRAGVHPDHLTDIEVLARRLMQIADETPQHETPPRDRQR